MTWLSKLFKIKKIEFKINAETTTEHQPSKIYLNTILVYSGILGLLIGMFQQNLNITIISALMLGLGIFSFVFKVNKKYL